MINTTATEATMSEKQISPPKTITYTLVEESNDNVSRYVDIVNLLYFTYLTLPGSPLHATLYSWHATEERVSV